MKDTRERIIEELQKLMNKEGLVDSVPQDKLLELTQIASYGVGFEDGYQVAKNDAKLALERVVRGS